MPHPMWLVMSSRAIQPPWECSGLTELWNRRAATFFGSGDGERAAPDNSKAGSSPRTPKVAFTAPREDSRANSRRETIRKRSIAHHALPTRVFHETDAL